MLRHPLFGIGLSSDWGAPWWRPPSVDNYWLVVAMRYGLPALAFTVAGHRAACGADLARRGLTEEAASYRKGYLIALAGLFLVLGTVHIWGAVSVFIMFYLGAGAWIYAAEPRRPGPRDAAPRAARADRTAGSRGGGDGAAREQRPQQARGAAGGATDKTESV